MSNAEEIITTNVIYGPHMTEKSFKDADQMQQYVFKVAKAATKNEIKSSIEQFFSVKVKSVNTLIQKGKTKSFKQRIGKRKDWKKAYVLLEDGHELDFIGATE